MKPARAMELAGRTAEEANARRVAVSRTTMVRAVAQKNLSRPDDRFADASDPSTIPLGKLNGIYRVSGASEPKRTYQGNYGFILDRPRAREFAR